MSVSLPELQNRISRLEAEAAELRRIVNGLTAGAPPLADGAGMSVSAGLSLPPEVVVPRPDAVAEYLRAHPDVTAIVGEMAAAVVQELRGERSEIVLEVANDDYVDETYLVFNVRLPTYDERFVERLDSVVEPFDDRFAVTDGWVLVTTDFVPAG